MPGAPAEWWGTVEGAPAPAEAPPDARPAPKPRLSEGIQSLERLIGGRWYAVIGAIIVVVGVALFFKLALQRGWISFPPAFRCVGGAMFGVALLAAGEWARKKISDWAAVGLSAAGLGVMYTAAFAAYNLYHLVGEFVALFMMGAVAVLGVGIGARARLVLVAAVSLTAGFLTTFLFDDTRAAMAVLPAYLLMLLVIGLALPAWRGGSFRAARAIAWWGTMTLGAAWMVEHAPSRPIVGILFLATAWSAVQAALALEAGRFGFETGSGTADEVVKPAGVNGESGGDRAGNWRSLACSFSTTSWAAILGVLLVSTSGLLPEWAVVGAMAVPAMALANVLAGHLRVLRDAPETDAQRLGACLAIQAGGLVIAAVALGISTSAQVLAWAAMGLAVVLSSVWVRSRGLAAYGLVLLTLAALRVFVYERFGPLNAAPNVVLGLQLTAWTAATAGVGAVWAIASWLVRRSTQPNGRWRVVSNLAAAASITLIFGAFLDTRMPAHSAAFVSITFAVALGILASVLRSGGISAYAILVISIASAYPAIRNWSERWNDGVGVSFAGIRLTAWSGVMAYGGSAMAAVGYVFRRGTGPGRTIGTGLLGAGMVFAFGALLHHGVRAEAVVVVLLVLGIALFAVGRALGSSGLKLGTALALVGAAAFVPTQAWWQSERAGPSIECAGLYLTVWTGVIAFAGACWILLAKLTSRTGSESSPEFSVVGGGVGLALLMASLIHDHASPASLCVAWLLILLATGIAGARERVLLLDRWAVAGLVVPVAGWMVSFPPWSAWNSQAAPPGLYRGFWLAMGVAAAAFVLARWIVRDGPEAMALVTRRAAYTIMSVMLFMATSLEIGRVSEIVFSDHTAQRAAVSVWWGVFAFAMIILGFGATRSGTGSRGFPLVRHMGLALLAVAVGKSLILDLNDVPALGRVISFVGLGLLMLAVAVIYGNVSKRLAAAAAGTSGRG